MSEYQLVKVTRVDTYLVNTKYCEDSQEILDKVDRYIGRDYNGIEIVDLSKRELDEYLVHYPKGSYHRIEQED